MPDASAIPEKKSPGAEMRRRILDAAALLLAENGYQATTLRGIADAAGLKAGSIYYHFASKEQITVEVLNEGVEYVSAAVSRAVEDLPADADGRTVLKAAIEAHLSALSAHKAYTRASIRCFSMVPQEIRDQTIDIRRDFDGIWLDTLKRARAQGALTGPHTAAADLREVHRIILGALNWAIEKRGGPSRRDHALSDTLLSLLSA
ncbi:TetR/AcrR family transcriptional regulator [Aquisalinus flavus]|uniref:TetR family transcriptional regulator n=1 Tax=Aquisalinus flavus TaxID=1526572 RepID=A0A8J2V484_9PROT|nr:TetR/AcrR family transcriptional regulator [Aquisalinus flavus]MBD0427000.1 TetR/AcrR family transcriptional regulator [Aquisalinus flavus]UNE46831.1 TetR/AcrR family transcriptional regulator [Aquisalinus flavus]GGC97576.1 TetR family transcriptional regulator [Aquisalinus flavus]